MGKDTTKALPDAIAQRIQARRKELGWSLAELARAADLKAPSYVLHIERGDKAPSEEVAERLARALGEDVDSFRAWARLRAGAGTLDDALQSARIAARAVSSIARDPGHAIVHGRLRQDSAPQRMAARSAARSHSFSDDGARVEAALCRAPSPPAIPLLEMGADPDTASPDGKRMTVAVERDQTLGARLATLDAPFAYRLSVRSVRRAPYLLPAGFYAILTRRFLPLEAHEAYAVRLKGTVELGFVHWDGQRLALLPHTNPADLVLFPARSEHELGRLIVGKVAIVAEPQTVRIES